MTKTYLKRDGAAAACRKAGIPREDYDKHISKVAQGFQVSLPDAPKVPTAAQPTKKAPTPAKKTIEPKAKKEKPAKAPRVSIGSTVRSLIEAGKTNAEIWPIIKKQFNLDDNKKWYPAWYRSDQARRAAAK